MKRGLIIFILAITTFLSVYNGVASFFSTETTPAAVACTPQRCGDGNSWGG